MRTFKYWTKHSRLNSFVPVPINLLSSGLIHTAILVYGLLLARTILSQKNNRIENGKVYVRYTNEQLAKDMGRSISTIKDALSELE